MTQDFLIIGGGVAGLAAAARLAPMGSVTLLEAEEAFGFHSSGRSAAMFEESYGAPPTVALNRASAPHHESANGGYLTPRGMLVVAARDNADAFSRDVEMLGLTPLPVEEAIARVPILNPDVVALAAQGPDARDIDTDRLMQDFARDARSHGANLVTRARVAKITRHTAGWTVETPIGTFEGRVLVNAAGAWADQVAAMAGLNQVGLQPYRRSMARLPAPDGHDVTGWPMVMGAGESWYAKPDAGKWLVSPAEEDPVDAHDAWADDLVLAEGIARYEAMVRVPVTRLESSWAGLRTFAPDRTLVLGPDPQDAGFVWFAGQGGQGFQTAPAASRLVADLIGGHAPDLDLAMVPALSPARFR